LDSTGYTIANDTISSFFLVIVRQLPSSFQVLLIVGFVRAVTCPPVLLIKRIVKQFIFCVSHNFFSLFFLEERNSREDNKNDKAEEKENFETVTLPRVRISRARYRSFASDKIYIALENIPPESFIRAKMKLVRRNSLRATPNERANDVAKIRPILPHTERPTVVERANNKKNELLNAPRWSTLT